MNTLRKLFSDTAIYGASSIFGRAINFLLVPLYTAVFSPDQYGVVTELYAYVAFLMVIYLYGVETTFFRFATKHEDKRTFYNLSVTNAIGISVLITGTLILFSSPIAALLDYPGASKYVVWLALILAMDTLVAVPFAKLRLEGRAKKFALFKISNILVNIGLNLTLYWPHWYTAMVHGQVPDVSQISVEYVFLSNLAASVFTMVLFLPEWVMYRPAFVKEKWNEMMNYATPLVIIGLAGVTNEMLSRALLRHWLPEGFYEGFSNIAVLGIFGACYKLSMLMNLSVQSFRYAYEPFFFSKSGEKGSPKLFAKVMNAFIIYGCLAFMLISIILPEIAPIVLRRNDYLEALHIVPMLLFGGLLLGVFYNLSVWYKLTDKTKLGAVITIIGAVVTIVLNWILIPILGYEGSAISTVAVYVTMVIVSYVWGQKNYHIPYKVSKGLTYMISSGLFIWFIYHFSLPFLTKYLVSLGALVFFVILVLILEKKRKTTE